ncbi:cytochrome c-type biogenesis protein [Streptomyces sp. PvR006]|nr:cytochrome c-type biogenesis protein [Streptomyces sp. PvR006]
MTGPMWAALAAGPAAGAVSGTLLLAVPVAVAAGLVSFLSPCVLPLVPGYLSYVTSLSVSDLAEADGGRRGRMVAGAALFVLGFSGVLVSGGALFGFVGRNLLAYQDGITLVLGLFTVVMGLAFAGWLPGFTQREVRSSRRPSFGLAGAPLLGVVFGVGWTPCIGPTLAAVQALAWNEASAGRGALLMVCYCVGLGAPFLLTALAFQRALRAFRWVRNHHVTVMRAGGALLVLVGLLLVSGLWTDLVYALQVRLQGTTSFL